AVVPRRGPHVHHQVADAHPQPVVGLVQARRAGVAVDLTAREVAHDGGLAKEVDEAGEWVGQRSCAAVAGGPPAPRVVPGTRATTGCWGPRVRHGLSRCSTRRYSGRSVAPQVYLYGSSPRSVSTTRAPSRAASRNACPSRSEIGP